MDMCTTTQSSQYSPQQSSFTDDKNTATCTTSSSTLIDSGRLGVFSIVGAGLAGIATAIGLRASGHRVVVFEHRQDVCEIGAAVECGPNGTRILDFLGLNIENLRGVPCTGVNEFNFRGKSILQRDFRLDEVDNWPVLLIHRRDLLAELLRIAQDPSRPGPPVDIRSSSKVVSLDCDSGVVELENGQVVQSDVVVAADGVHSMIRSSVIGFDSPGCFSGEATYRALVRTSEAFKDPDIKACIDMNRFTMFIARDRRVIVFPCADGELLNVMSIVPSSPVEGENETWGEWDVVDDLVEEFEDFPDYVKRLLALCHTCGRWKLYDHKPLPRWVKGRTILIGDAAHPMLPTQGQGLCQSLEDAEAMETMFSDAFNDFSATEVTKRLERVYKCRYERTARIQELSRTQAAGPRRAGHAQDSHDFSWFNWATLASADWLQRIDQRQEQLGLPQMVPRKVNQLIPETDLLDVKQGGRVSDSKTPVPGNQKEEAPHLSWSTPRNEPAAVAIDREGDKGKIARGWCGLFRRKGRV